MERLAQGHLTSMGTTLEQTVGLHHRQRLVWLGLLAMPLLFPIALPGMASAVGLFGLLVAVGLWSGQAIPLPGWLARRELNDRIKSLIANTLKRFIHLIARLGRPRWLAMSHHSVRGFNGLMLAAAGLAMMVPVPIISFDNVLPALALVLIAWGLRLRDGLMLLLGYVATAMAVASVGLLWWGGTHLATELLSTLG